MKYLINALLITALALGGLGLMTPAMAAEGQGMRHMQGMGMGMGSGKHRGGESWKSTLSDSQKKQIAKLKLDHKKQAYPVKAKITQAKVELAMLITADTPKQGEINQKIDELVKLKAEKMRLKAAHKIEVRKVLNKDQRVLFDIKMMKKALHGKKGGHRKGHH